MLEITVTEVLQKESNGEVLHLVDVREAEEIATGIIPGAIHIPLGEIPTRLNELDKEKEYIIICQSGGRSGNATAYMTQEGYKATNMLGGMAAWTGKTI